MAIFRNGLSISRENRTLGGLLDIDWRIALCFGFYLGRIDRVVRHRLLACSTTVLAMCYFSVEQDPDPSMGP